MNRFVPLLVAVLFPLLSALAQEQAGDPWRPLPLIKDGNVHPDWAQIGWGGFGVEEDSLRTDCDEKGMGLLLFTKEKFGNCQIRVVYKSKDARSNAGVFVRIDDGILRWLKEKPAPLKRDKGKLSEESFKNLMADSEEERGAWYPVHRGYEVQICDESDEYHRTGAIYSLAKAAAAPPKPPTEWKTMVITLKGNLILVDIDGKRVTTFDPEGKDVPRERKWFEPKREPKRPQIGYIGLQNHDPGDVVYFREVSVRALGEDELTPTPDPDRPDRVHIPENLDAALAELQIMLSPRDIAEIRAGSEDRMIEYHFGLGLWMRNEWGLWGGSRLSRYFKDMGIHHPDDMSSIILHSFWRHLNGKPLELEAQVARYREYWNNPEAWSPSGTSDRAWEVRVDYLSASILIGVVVIATGVGIAIRWRRRRDRNSILDRSHSHLRTQ